MLSTFRLIIMLAFLGGCSTAPPYAPNLQPIETGRLLYRGANDCLKMVRMVEAEVISKERNEWNEGN